jgi:CBS domain-containing protein
VSAVSEIISPRSIVSVDLSDNPSALDVAKLMVKRRVGSVVAIEGGKPVGIITERDILKKVSGQDRCPVKARDLMSSPLVTIKAIDSIETAAVTMAKNKVKRVVVLEEDGSAVGVLSVTDITKRLSKILTDEYNRYGSLKAMLEMVRA